MQEISRDVYIETGYLGVTLGAISLPHGLILIDAPPRPEDVRSWRSALLNLGGGVERLLVNLDAHVDRTLGGRAMECTVVANEKAAQVFRSRPTTFKSQSLDTGAEWELSNGLGSIRWALPEITFSNRLSIYWDDFPVALEQHLGPNVGAVWVVLPESGVVFVGDAVLNNQPPFLANADLPAWIESLKELLTPQYQNYTLVSGRGGMVPVSAVYTQIASLEKIQGMLELLAGEKALPEATENSFLSCWLISKSLSAARRSTPTACAGDFPITSPGATGPPAWKPKKDPIKGTTSMSHSTYEPVVEVTRGNIVELIHFGAMAVVDASGNLLASYGDADTVTFLRSTAKPFQALPFVEMGGDQYFHLSQRELAVICASHSGTDDHVGVISGIQKKVGVSESDLLCGVHEPFDEETARAMRSRGEALSPNRHNCSGKHTGMLAHAVMRGLPKADYVNPAHPVQQTILRAFAEMCGLAPEQVQLGTDGCSVPTFAVPLRNAAWAYARLCDPSGLAPQRAEACRRITQAMTSNADMVAGPGRFDTRLMSLANGAILAKAGAEGYQGIGLMPGALGPGTPALGITFKISDGDTGGRARPTVAMEVLRQLGAISRQEMDALLEFTTRPIYNFRQLKVGEIRPHFTLVKSETALTQ